ncbi:MAG: ATPase [Firmicutes bacterium]|nr:ATPase [Bacillota bacterium]
MRYVLGIDGGGSQTTAVVADERGFPVGWGSAGGANHQTVGLERAVQALAQAADEALARAGLGSRDIGMTHYGLAGADRPRDFEILNGGLATLPFHPWSVTSDAWMGLRAGSPQNVGVAVVCGSGTNAVGRDAAGHQVQIGGFGYAFGDTAGGHHLAVETFRAAVRAWQRRGPRTRLEELVPQHLQRPNMSAVYDDWLDSGAEIPLSLAELAHQAADQGDEVARALLREMGEELGMAARAVLDHLDPWPGPVPVVLLGSILQRGRNPGLLNALAEAVRLSYPSAELKILSVRPVYGAVLMALDALGLRAESGAAAAYRYEEENSR